MLIEVRENQEEIQKITDRAVQILGDKHGLRMTSNSNMLPTIVHAYVSATIEYLNSNKVEDGSVELNMFQLFDIGISHLKEDDAEKEGNFTPYLVPGQTMKLMVKDDEVTEVED